MIYNLDFKICRKIYSDSKSAVHYRLSPLVFFLKRGLKETMENQNDQKPKFVTFPLSYLINPPIGGYYYLYKNYWWLTDEKGNPVFFKKSSYDLIAQCNKNKEHQEKRIDNKKYFGIKFFENIFEPVKQYEIIEKI